MLSRRAIARALMSPLLLLTLSCEGWDLFGSDDTYLGDEPYTLSILSTESCPLPEGLNPRTVMIMSYQVRLRGRHPEKVPANYFYASLLTTDGARYLADFPGCSPVLSASPVKPGEAADGYLNFPIPPGKTPHKLVYAPTLSGKPKGSSLLEITLSDARTEGTDQP